MYVDGWIDYTVKHDEGRPDAKVYRVTEAGEELLRNRLTEPYTPLSPDFADPEFMIRYTFAIFLRFRDREIHDEPWLLGLDRGRGGRPLANTP